MKSLDKVETVEYSPKFDWPIKTNLKFQKRTSPVFDDDELDAFFLGDKTVVSEALEKGEIKYTLYTWQPLPSGRLYYLHGEWYQTCFNIRSCAKSLEEAERVGWEHHQTILDCNHNFHKYDWSLNGHAQCTKCYTNINDYYLDNKVWEARDLASLIYSSSKDENPVINRLRKVYQRVSHLVGIKKDQHIQLGCLAWLHTISKELKLDLAIEVKCGKEVLEFVQQYKEFNAGELKKFRKAPYVIKLIKLINGIEDCSDIINTITDTEIMYSSSKDGMDFLEILKGTDPYLENFYNSNLNYLKKKSLNLGV